MGNIILDVLPVEPVVIDQVLVVDSKGSGLLCILRSDNVLVAWPGRMVVGGFVPVCGGYPFRLNADDLAAVHPGPGMWSPAAINRVAKDEALRVR